MKITLKKHLIITSIISVLIPLLLFASIFYVMGGRLLMNEFKKSTIENLYLVDKAVTLYIEKIKHTVNTMSNNNMIRNLDSHKLSNYKDYTEWTEMEPYKSTEEENEVYEYLKLIHLNNPDLGAVYIGTDSGGFTMYPPSHRRPYYNPSERPWYREVEEMKGQITITSPFKSSDKNYNIFAVAKQIYFPKTREHGVVSVNIELDTITNIIDQLNIGKTGFVILTKKNYSIGTEWIFYFLITKSELLEPLNKMLVIIVIICVLVISIFTPLAVYTTVRSLVPLDKLNNHLYNLYRGNADLNKRISIYAKDEVGETIGNFNLLSEKLNNLFIDMKKTTDTISSNISEYTKDMLFASTEIEKTKSAIGNIDKVVMKISDILPERDTTGSASAKKSQKEISDRMLEDLSSCLDELKEYMEDIKTSYNGINSSIDISIEHCRLNKEILKKIRNKVSTYKTRPAAE